jgi:polyhydroxybutyrate depolymerase
VPVRVRVLALVTLLLLTGCTPRRGERGADPTSTGSAATGSSSAGADASPAVGKSTGEMTIDGLKRTYRVYRPAGLTKSAPLVMVLHGAFGTGKQAEDSYGWDPEADTGKFLVVYPDGTNRTWDADPDCCGKAAANHVDDVAFLSKLAASFGALVDDSKIFATGISNGSLMSYRLACDTKIFAAIGPDSGTMINPCPDPQPLSIIAIHGTADKTIPYNGGPGKRDNAGAGSRIPIKIDGPPIPDLIATWRKTDSCGTPKSTVAGSVTTSVATCPDDHVVELITIAGAGHQWPGSKNAPVAQKLLGLDAPSTALQATPTIWKFFATKSLS